MAGKSAARPLAVKSMKAEKLPARIDLNAYITVGYSTLVKLRKSWNSSSHFPPGQQLVQVSAFGRLELHRFRLRDGKGLRISQLLLPASERLHQAGDALGLPWLTCEIAHFVGIGFEIKKLRFIDLRIAD